jgi:hypothetical protein
MMIGLKAAPRHLLRRRYQVFVASLGLIVCLALAACPLGALAVHLRRR